MDDVSTDLGPMGPAPDRQQSRSDEREAAEIIEGLRNLVDEWFSRNHLMPKSLKHEGFWVRVYAMMVSPADQVALCLDPLLDEPLPIILAIMVRARLRRFAEESGNEERAKEIARQEHALAQAADDEHFKVLALSALVPYLSRVMDLGPLSKETTRIALLGQELCNRTLDGCIETAQRGDAVGGSVRRAIYVCTSIEGFQNLHLWLMVQRLLELDVYDLARDFVARRELQVVKMFGDLAHLPEVGNDSFFRMLAAWELSVYEERHGLDNSTGKSPEQWREAALTRARISDGLFQPDQIDLQFYATFSMSLSSTASAIEVLSTGAVDPYSVMRLSHVHRLESRLATMPHERAHFEQRAKVLEDSIGMTWPHYSEHIAMSDLW